jgi:hypothetical protein
MTAVLSLKSPAFIGVSALLPPFLFTLGHAVSLIMHCRAKLARLRAVVRAAFGGRGQLLNEPDTSSIWTAGAAWTNVRFASLMKRTCFNWFVSHFAARQIKPRPPRSTGDGQHHALMFRFETSALSHSASFDRRRRPENVAHCDGGGILLPNQHDQPLAAGDAGAEKVPLQHGVVLRHDRNHHGWVFRALTLVDACSVRRR